jgi:polysaccharide biosynthesis transport protein
MQTHPRAPEHLGQYVDVVRRRAWSIAIITAATVAAALVFSFRQTPVYTSEARVLVTPFVTSTVPVQPDLETERGLVGTAAVADIVARRTGVKASTEALLQDLSVKVETDTSILDVRYSATSPARARTLAQGFANAYLSFRGQEARRQFESQAAAFTARIEALRKQLQRIAEKMKSAPASQQAVLSSRQTEIIASMGALQQALQTVLANQSATGGGGQVVEPAALASSPSSPRHVRDGALALVVGLALGVGVAFVRERLDDRLEGRGDLETNLRAPVLAIVPRLREWTKSDEPELISIHAPDSPPAEAYRTLRTNLQHIARSADFRVLTVTSPLLGEGKTTTASNLAVVFAQTRLRVVVVSCDLRKPRLHRFFGVRGDPGVTSVLSGRAPLTEVLHKPTRLETLRVLASGPVPENPAELLASWEMDELLRQLREASDFVILDTPPLLPVADALILAPKSDGVLVVADAGSTTREALRHAREQLDHVGANVVGGILNNLDPATARGYGGAYGYASRRYAESRRKAPATGNGRAATPAESPVTEDLPL